MGLKRMYPQYAVEKRMFSCTTKTPAEYYHFIIFQLFVKSYYNYGCDLYIHIQGTVHEI